jgi:hypothetical protein
LATRAAGTPRKALLGYGRAALGLMRPRLRESRNGKAEGPAIEELRGQQQKRVAAIRKLRARYAGATAVISG